MADSFNNRVFFVIFYVLIKFGIYLKYRVGRLLSKTDKSSSLLVSSLGFSRSRSKAAHDRW